MEGPEFDLQNPYKGRKNGRGAHFNTHAGEAETGRTLGSSFMVKGIFLLKEGIPETIKTVDASQ